MVPQRWLLFLGAIFFLGIILQVEMLSILPIGLGVIIIISDWWRKQSLKDVHYKRKFHYTRVFPGENVDVSLEIENRKLLPISWLRIQDPWPKAIGPVDEDILAPSHQRKMGLLVNIFSLRWFEKSRREYQLKFRKRGVYTVGPASLESGDLFGIYSDRKEIENEEHLTIFPRLIDVEKLNFPAENPFGDSKSRKRLFEDPSRPMGVREYQPEDGFRSVHWPATAKTGNLKVKVFQPTSAKVLLACMNCATFPRHWEGVNPELLEYVVRITATILSFGMQDGYQIGLISNGTLSNSDQSFRIAPGRSPRHLAHILQSLAGVTPLVSAPFERYLLKEIPKVPYGATLVILTALLTPELRETLVRIKSHGRKIVLIALAKEIPEVIPGITTLHFPFDPSLVADDFDVPGEIAK